MANKSEIYNLIILDESGSMSHIRKNTIDGCNETINTIKATQEKYAETQEHYVSIYAFQSNDSNPSHYIVKNVPAEAAKHISASDYDPWGGTPLYDAIGNTLSDLKATTKNKEMAIGSVTIITDGYENSSRDYTHTKVAKMISELTEMGWNFNFIGADIDVNNVASSLNIENAMAFDKSEEGTRMMFARANKSRMAYFNEIDCYASAQPEATVEERRKLYKRIQKGFFNK